MFLLESNNKYLSNKKFIQEPYKGKLSVNGHSNILDVYIAGLGMNHNVFLHSFDMITKPKEEYNYLLAITLSGFNEYVKNNSKNQEIKTYSETEQVLDAATTIKEHIKKIKIEKNIDIGKVNIFGFSYGADLLTGIANELIGKNTKINKLFFSDVNLNKETAFLTGQITEIENEPKNIDEKNKKGEFIKRVIDFSDDDKILDNLEYLRISYNVNWNQMVKSAVSAFANSGDRIEEIKSFLNTNTNISCMFIISERTINKINNGYLQGIKNIMKQTINLNRNISYHSTKKHFDGISYATIYNVNNFFRE